MFFFCKIRGREIEYQCSPRFVRQENHGDFTYLLFGKVYGEDSTDLESLSKKIEKSVFLKGRYILIKIDVNGVIQFWLDKYRLLNPIFRNDNDTLWFGNVTPPKNEFDPIAQESLIEAGATVYPRTLFKDTTFLTGNGTYNSHLTMIDHALLWPVENTEPSVEALENVFKQSVEELIREWTPRYFRTSGGLDSRMIALTIPASYLPSLTAQVLCHPELNPEDDRDVLGAELVAKLLNIPLEIHRPQKENYNYLGAFPTLDMLSGLYGGEFFGGILHHHTPVKTVSELPESPAGLEWRQREALIGPRRLQTEIFLSSFRSTIYGSVKYSWANPWQLNQFCKSPFVEEGVMNFLLATPYEDIKDYKLYSQVYQKISRDKGDLPLSSPILLFQEGFRPFSEGQEPKLVNAPAPKPTIELGALNLKSYNTDQ